jgi:hypothetical protein
MMAAENETPGGESGGGAQYGGMGAQGSGRRNEGDLLAERRALRAAESGEAALIRRAEAAEATVQTLERHVVSLQARLAEADDERTRLGELLEAERTVALEREHELRRVKQREYAEQQLRVEAEDRLVGLDREDRDEVEELARRLSASEQHALELSDRLEDLQLQLAEAEQVAAAEQASTRHAEGDLAVRLSELEERAGEIQRGLEAEHAARERSEQLLATMRQGHSQMELLVGDMKQLIIHLTSALSARRAAAQPAAPAPVEMPASVAPRPSPPAAAVEVPLAQRSEGAPPELAEPARGAEMAEALAAAVERLRARAQTAPPATAETPRPTPAGVPHKHSRSLIGRLRNRRKQRRSR